MAVQSSTSKQSFENNLRMDQNVNTETLSMSAPKILLKIFQIFLFKIE